MGVNGRYKTHGPFNDYKLIKKNLPLKVKNIKTKGKFIYIIFDKEIYLFNTLGLSGGWCYLKNGNTKYEFSNNLNDYATYLPEQSISSYVKNAINHLNVEFKTNFGSLYFFDVLSFGTLKVTNKDELIKKLGDLGPDIMEFDTDYQVFKNQIIKESNLNKAIGIVLMDQKVISGIGNYLRSEILYISKINPFRKVKNLSNIEIRKLFNNSKILTWGDYDYNLALKLNIINKNTKLPAYYDRMFYVYNQTKDIYDNNIIKKELYEGSQKRFIYYVSKIQL